MDRTGVIRVVQPALKPRDRISIQAGPFEGILGRVDRESNEHKRVAILLESLSSAGMLIEKRWLEPVPE